MGNSDYSFTRTLEHSTFEDMLGQVTAALAEEGFGVLTEIDVSATLKKKLDVDFRQYRIFGACNPTLAHRALQLDANVGVLLPCNVVVQEAPQGNVSVTIVNPQAMFESIKDPALAPIAREAQRRLDRVMRALH